MEGCGYRDLHPYFQDLDVRIVAVGFSSTEATHAWALEEGFPYEVWTDDDRTLALAYGAATSATANSPRRVTVLIGADGLVSLEYDQGIDVNAHPTEVLSDCHNLYAADGE